MLVGFGRINVKQRVFCLCGDKSKVSHTFPLHCAAGNCIKLQLQLRHLPDLVIETALARCTCGTLLIRRVSPQRQTTSASGVLMLSLHVN